MEPSRSHTPKGRAAREHILRKAEPLVAAHGFHGTSMRDIAGAAGVPLANLVYHFAKKEELHRSLLAAIAADVLGALGSPDAPLEAMVRALVRWSLANERRVRLLMRELLDNPARVSRAGALPLAPVLETLAAAVRRAGHPRPELAVLHVVGAVSYVVAARPTVKRIVGTATDEAMMTDYEETAVRFARSVFGEPGEPPR